MAVPQFKAVLIATPQMRSESGLTFRSKQSAVWPADPRGRRGCREPGVKTCYLPSFHIMYRPDLLSIKGGRACSQNDCREAATRSDQYGVRPAEGRQHNAPAQQIHRD